MIPAWSLADRLRKIRRDVLGNLSQEEMAVRLDVPKPRYGAWENGHGRPRDMVAIAKRIEVISGVPATWVLGLDEFDGPQDPSGGARPRGLYSVKDRTSNPKVAHSDGGVVSLFPHRVSPVEVPERLVA